MTVSVSTIAQTTDLTTRDRLAAEIGTIAAGDYPLVDALIKAASAAIVSYCHRTFAREAVTELLPGFGGIQLQLKRTPIITVSAVLRDSAALTDYTISDREAGWLYRQGGWEWPVQAYQGLSGGGAWMDIGTPLPNQEEPRYSVSYVAGYLLPSQDRFNVATISVDQTDSSFNDSASLFPSLLKAGDVLVASGFTNAANNGRFVITGTPTAAKVVVSSTLVTEGAAAGRTVTWEPPDGCRPIHDVEKACLEAVKGWKLGGILNPAVVERQLGPARERFSESLGLSLALPGTVVGLLRPWVRKA
jgi:hypothetical protein